MAPLNYLVPVLMFLVIFSMPHVESKLVECNEANAFQNDGWFFCRLSDATADTEVKMNSPNCKEVQDYGLWYDSRAGGYIYFTSGCGGWFNVSTPTPAPEWKSWGAWSPCSVSCGGGMKTRTRACSTGVDEDCSMEVTDNEWRMSCNKMDCSTTDNKDNEDSEICGKATDGTGFRIIGGIKAKACEFPWMVMVYDHVTSQTCGGSIIDKKHILTAAHCLVSQLTGLTSKPSDLIVYSGSSEMPFEKLDSVIEGLILRKVSLVKVHKDYTLDLDLGTLKNDIAILTLTDPIMYDACHVPTCLPKDSQRLALGTSVRTMGWGRVTNSRADSSPQLLFTDVSVTDSSKCVAKFQMMFDDKTKICVSGDDSNGSCEGDSGGPLLYKRGDQYFQYGIVSAGGALCGVGEEFYTRVTSYLDWISENTK